VHSTKYLPLWKSFRRRQGEKNESFYDLSATILEDLTGVEVDAEELKTARSEAGVLKPWRYSVPTSTTARIELKPESGNLEKEAPRRREVLGFLMNSPLGKEHRGFGRAAPRGSSDRRRFRAYGELMAKNLSLGRQRARVATLMQILVADPLTYKLQEQYGQSASGHARNQEVFRTPDSNADAQGTRQEGSRTRESTISSPTCAHCYRTRTLRYTYRVGAPDAGLPADKHKPQRWPRRTRLHERRRRPLITLSRRHWRKQKSLCSSHMEQSTSSWHQLSQQTRLRQRHRPARSARHSLSHSNTRRLGLSELKKRSTTL